MRRLICGEIRSGTDKQIELIISFSEKKTNVEIELLRVELFLTV